MALALEATHAPPTPSTSARVHQRYQAHGLPRRRRVRRCPLEPASAVAFCRPWRGLPLMPRHVPSHEPQVQRLLVRRREPPRPRRVRARPLEPASAVASWRPWRRLLLMPRRVPRASRPGAAAPRAAAPRAARLELRRFGRRGFCSACTVVGVACVCCVSTGRCDPRWRSSGPSCMRERGGGGTLERVFVQVVGRFAARRVVRLARVLSECVPWYVCMV